MTKSVLLFSSISALLCGHLSATEPVLLFTDDFTHDEATPDKEDIGNGWTSNSA